MQALQGLALVSAWEKASQHPRASRAVALLAEGCGLQELEAAALSLPGRDAALLALRQLSFGDALHGFATCSSCGERLEFTLGADEMAARMQQAGPLAGPIESGPWVLQFRFATTADIEAAAAEPDLAAARHRLLCHCVSVVREGRKTALSELPPDLLATADERLVAIHDAAELTVSLACPACDIAQDVTLDLGEFLWAETRHAARRLLRDVHELAWAYGWSESAILSMSPPRRAAYLELVRA